MKNGLKKIGIYSEIVYVIALLCLSFSVAMVAAADFGVSMVVAPAYILSLKIEILSFGRAEYVVQAVVFIVFCIIIRKFKPVYITSFITCLIYGLMLDIWRIIIPAFNPSVTTPGSFSMPVRIIFFIVGMLMTSFSVCLFYRTYFYPQVYDFFVKGISEKYNLNRTRFKIICDVFFLILAFAMTMIFFKKIEGIGIGTIIMTVLNGLLIGLFGKMVDKCCNIHPASKKLASLFDL